MSNSNNNTLTPINQLICGGVAGSVAKTVTAPLSRLTILFQVHSLVTTKKYAPQYADSVKAGALKIMERGGILSFWKGNLTSVLHRFPYSAINFFCYENTLRLLHEKDDGRNVDDVTDDIDKKSSFMQSHAFKRFMAGACAGCMACFACYPLDLVRTRLTTELPGKEHYKGILDAFVQISRQEGLRSFYTGMGPTMFVAVPNFAISYTIYGSLKEYVLDDDLFYNLRQIDDSPDENEQRMGISLTLLCGATAGTTATVITYPFDTIRRRMQIQSLHLAPDECLSGRQQFIRLLNIEGPKGMYRGLTPELMKVIPFVGTTFLVYEFMKQQLSE